MDTSKKFPAVGRRVQVDMGSRLSVAEEGRVESGELRIVGQLPLPPVG